MFRLIVLQLNICPSHTFVRALSEVAVIARSEKTYARGRSAKSLEFAALLDMSKDTKVYTGKCDVDDECDGENENDDDNECNREHGSNSGDEFGGDEESEGDKESDDKEDEELEQEFLQAVVEVDVE